MYEYEDSEVMIRIFDLAEQIYAEATTLKKPLRREISDLSKLISWLVFDEQMPGDPDSAKAIAELRQAAASRANETGGTHHAE